MRITKKQIEAILALPGPKRYSHFIKLAADQNMVWGLYSEGWALAGTDDQSNQNEVFPIWPAREYAALCATGIWEGYCPREISLDDLLNGLIPRLKDTGRLLGVFYTPNDKGVLPSFDQFVADILSERARIE
ncbi:MAG: DUF2750 domain-containing protein [Thermodesulfobacteriota bacterium]